VDYSYLERLSIQRQIVLDGVTYVHDRTRRSPRKKSLIRPAAPSKAVARSVEALGGAVVEAPVEAPVEVAAEEAFGSDWSPSAGSGEAEWPAVVESTGAEPEPAAIDAPVDGADWPTQPGAPETGTEEPAEVEPPWGDAAALAAPSEPSPEPAPAPGRPILTAPPAGYAIEFGSGRLVPIHSMRGRMSYPSSYYYNQG